MQQDQIVADTVEIIDDPLVDLAACGCTPLDSASALIAAGFTELSASDEPLARQLTVYRLFLDHIMDALA